MTARSFQISLPTMGATQAVLLSCESKLLSLAHDPDPNGLSEIDRDKIRLAASLIAEVNVTQDTSLTGA